VTDVAAAFLSAAETGRVGAVYNVGAGAPQSVNRLVELLGGTPAPAARLREAPPRRGAGGARDGPGVVHIPKRPGEPDCTWADIAKITAELGWRPQVTFEDGVAKVLAAIDDWRDAPLWDPDSIAAATKTWFDALAADAKATAEA
jgi:UDP-glucose 4-epimerase